MNVSDKDLAERLARLTDMAGRAVSGETPNPEAPGAASLERVIRAFAGLHRHTEAEVSRTPRFVWGHLEVLERIGSGSYGEVYCAFDKVLERDVALKLRSSDAITARAYINEARRLARVRHPHVLAVHGAAVHDGRAGLWSDLIEGSTLTEWIASEGPRPRSEVLTAALMLTSALQAVHRAGLIHGDVKPGNIMRDYVGDLVLMDFGTALESVAGGVQLAAGTPLTMAPEQLQGSKVTQAADIYALGVVLYFLCCAAYPIRADSIESLAAAHRSGLNLDRDRLQARCGRRLAQLIERLMATDPAARPSASAAFAILEDLVREPERRRKRLLVAGVVAALSVALGASLIALVRVDVERKAAALANARATSVRDFMHDFLASPKPELGGADARVVDVLSDALPVAELRFADEPQALVEVITEVAFSYYGVGAYVEAEPLLERALKLGRSAAMPVDRRLALEVRLAAVKAFLAGADAPTAPIEALLEASRSVLGPAHEVTLEASLILGRLYYLRSDYAATESISREVLRQRPADRYASDGQRLRAQAQLVTLFGEQERWDEAEAVLGEALTAAAADGNRTDSIDLLLTSAASTLASRRGQFARAEALMTPLIGALEKKYGSRHTALRGALNDLAVSQRMQGKLDEAIATLRRALELARSQLSEDHHEILTLRENLASALADAGDRETALALREQALAGRIRAFRPGHRDTLVSMLNLAEQYVEDGKAARGLELANDAVGYARSELGPNHLITLEAREISARAQLALGNPSGARDVLREVHADKRRYLGADDVYTLRSAGFLAEALVALGDSATARALLEPAVLSLQSRVDEDQPDLRRLRTQLARIRPASDPSAPASATAGRDADG